MPLSLELRLKINEAATSLRNINAALSIGYFAVATEASLSGPTLRGFLEFGLATCVAQGTKELSAPPVQAK